MLLSLRVAGVCPFVSERGVSGHHGVCGSRGAGTQVLNGVSCRASLL